MEVLRPVTALPVEPVFESDFTDTLPHTSHTDDTLTDSMVTIRLSDPHVLPIKKPSALAEANDTTRNEEHKSVQSTHEAASSDRHDCELHEDEDVTLQGVVDKQMPLNLRPASNSTLASSASEDSSSEQGSSFLHIRTGSLDSCSSGESAHVDWEELDKNEKEEQKDECSDDVSQIYTLRIYELILTV